MIDFESLNIKLSSSSPLLIVKMKIDNLKELFYIMNRQGNRPDSYFKETEALQCFGARRRSIFDTYLIARGMNLFEGNFTEYLSPLKVYFNDFLATEDYLPIFSCPHIQAPVFSTGTESHIYTSLSVRLAEKDEWVEYFYS